MIKQTKTHNRIVGENIIVNGNRASFLYTIPSFKYSNKKIDDVERHIDKLYSIIQILNSKTPGLQFCLSNVQIPITIGEIKRDLVDNIRKWKKEYSEKEIKFIERINTGCYTLFILEIFADVSSDSDLTIGETVKSFISSIENGINKTINLDIIFGKEKDYENILHNFGCGRCTQYMTFRYLLNNYFPGIYFHTTDFSTIKYNTVLNSIYQEYSFKMEQFCSHNNFISIFGLKPKTKYCSILQYTDLPIVKENTMLSFIPDNLRVYVRIPDQKKVVLSMKRQREDLAYSVEGTSTDISNEIDTARLYNSVINRLKDGVLGCECTIVQLVEADSEEDLKKKRTDIVINMMKNEVIARPFLNQYKALKTYFIDRNVVEYDLMSDLKYALSLKIDNFATIGDFDSKHGIGLMKIGEEII